MGVGVDVNPCADAMRQEFMPKYEAQFRATQKNGLVSDAGILSEET